MRKSIGIGITFILIAVLMILNLMGYLPASLNLVQWVIAVVLLVIIIKSLFRIEFFGVFIPIAILTIMFKEELNLENVGNGEIIIIAIFLAIGFSIIFRKARMNRVYEKNWNCHGRNGHIHYYEYDTEQKYNKYNKKKNEGSFNEESEVNDEKEEIISYKSELASITRFVKSNNLKQLNVSNSLGQITVYLDKATIANDGAIINVKNSLGSVRLYIPKEYKIDNKVDAILGNVSIVMEHEPDFIENTITVRGNVSLGDLTIILI